MPSTHAYGFTSPTSACTPIEITRRTPGPLDVVFDIQYAGICHSDIHTARGEWGQQRFPLVPGHEIAGIVREVGERVSAYQVGDRVGVGCMVDSCGECDYCLAGREQYCPKTNWTYGSLDWEGNPTQGGYSQSITVTEKFVFRIPDSLPLDQAAPLLCAGVTTYSPLKAWVKPGMKVAIVGLGGLGHVGVQIAAAMGAEVSVLSHTLAKKADGLAFGASDYYATSDPDTFPALRNRFDMILSTVSATDDYSSYLSSLTKTGVLVNVGLPGDSIQLKLPALGPARTLMGSQIGGCAETQEMLDFCGAHGVLPRIETISGEQITEAYDQVVNSAVRYRFVIDTDTLGDRG
ncbi:MAG: NAD(P)-dependent alcohol dehydrogenase [Propionibacteriaceae bacterium]|nr:NAD(P)-dependent alcohol dehydrogenase [Propionibacteriaceae bacterium]